MVVHPIESTATGPAIVPRLSRSLGRSRSASTGIFVSEIKPHSSRRCSYSDGTTNSGPTSWDSRLNRPIRARWIIYGCWVRTAQIISNTIYRCAQAGACHGISLSLLVELRTERRKNYYTRLISEMVCKIERLNSAGDSGVIVVSLRQKGSNSGGAGYVLFPLLSTVQAMISYKYHTAHTLWFDKGSVLIERI